jgi:hypothetical protein
MSPNVEEQAPPAGEEIHLPGGSLQPIMLTVGITVLLLGLTTTTWVILVGALISVLTLVVWIRDAVREYRELPMHHEHH